MSALTLAQSHTAVGPNITVSFGAQGGTTPYVYSVRPNGASGVVNSSTGLYTAPSAVPTAVANLYDTVIVTDGAGATATGQVLVGDALLLFCEVIQSELGLQNGRVYLWDQKIGQATDAGLYIAVSVLTCKAFGNTNRHNAVSGGLNSEASVNMAAILQIDIISRDNSARTRKEEVLMALMSDYAQAQQETNSFYIGKLPAGAQFANLSLADGAAIPYRFTISISIQYYATKTKPVNYIGSFSPVAVTTQS